MVAGALAQLNDKRGIQVLIEYLKSTEAHRRFQAMNYLTAVAGETLGYTPYSAERDRNKAIERWESWYKTKFGED